MNRVVLMISIPLAWMSCAYAQWTPQTSNTSADLRGIHAVGNGVAWASGTNGTVLRTEDGGYVWQTCAIPPGAEKLDFRGVQAFDANTAIVMSSGKGDLSRLYKTADGCHTWKLVFRNPDPEGFWDAVQFYDRITGWILGDPTNGQFQLWQTGDAGANWRREGKSDTLRADPTSAGAFAASNSALTLGAPKTMFPEFASGGRSGAHVYAIIGKFTSGPPKDHWRRSDTPVASDSESAGIFSFLFLSGTSTAVVVGGDYTQPDDSANTAAYSVDGGRTWQPAEIQPRGYRSSVAYEETSKTWITVGPNGTDISTDDGKNWRPLHPDSAVHEAPDADRNWNAISLPFVVGPRGRIGKLNSAALKR